MILVHGVARVKALSDPFTYMLTYLIEGPEINGALERANIRKKNMCDLNSLSMADPSLVTITMGVLLTQYIIHIVSRSRDR